MEYDLSKVLFIATANIANIAPALRDRMEMINIAGYLIEEKVRIALDHLLPKQREAHGIKEQGSRWPRGSRRHHRRLYPRVGCPLAR